MMWAIKHKSGRVLFVTDSKVTTDNREKMGWIVEEVKMTSREQFDEWCINRGISITKSPGYDGYQNPRTKVIWEGWQASRDAIEIKLPDVEDKKWYSSWHGTFRAEAFWLETRRVLNGYGLKVKK